MSIQTNGVGGDMNIDLKQQDISILFDMLVKQYPLYRVKWSICIQCKKRLARGHVSYCKKCVSEELIKKGVNPAIITEMMQLLENTTVLHDKINKHIAEAIGLIKNQIEQEKWRCCGGIVLTPDEQCPICGDKP